MLTIFRPLEACCTMWAQVFSCDVMQPCTWSCFFPFICTLPDERQCGAYRNLMAIVKFDQPTHHTHKCNGSQWVLFFFLATNRWFLEISVAFIQADERESLELNKLAPSTAHLMGEKWNHTHWKYRFNNSREEKNKHIKKHVGAVCTGFGNVAVRHPLRDLADIAWASQRCSLYSSSEKQWDQHCLGEWGACGEREHIAAEVTALQQKRWLHCRATTLQWLWVILLWRMVGSFTDGSMGCTSLSG